MTRKLFYFPVCISCFALMGFVSYSHGITPKHKHIPRAHSMAATLAGNDLLASHEKTTEKDIYKANITVSSEKEERELSVFRMVANDPFSR